MHGENAKIGISCAYGECQTILELVQGLRSFKHSSENRQLAYLQNVRS